VTFRALTAAALLPLLALPALAADVPPEADLALSCSVILSLKGDDARDSGDASGATEWELRSDELEGRGRSLLADAGLSAEDAENVVMNTALKVSFNTTLGAPPYTDEECFALLE
jgi:hypothetical protein